MINITGKDLVQLSFIGKHAELHLNNKELIRGWIIGLTQESIDVRRQESGTLESILIEDIEMVVFGSRGHREDSRTIALKHQKQCKRVSEQAELVLQTLFREEIDAYAAECKDSAVQKYLQAELKKAAGIFSQDYLASVLDRMESGREGPEGFRRWSCPHILLLFRMEQYDQAIVSVLSGLEEDGFVRTVLKLACLSFQMRNHIGTLYWLDKYYETETLSREQLKINWWYYLRMCSRFGNFDQMESRLAKVAQVSAKTAMESLAFLFASNSSYVFAARILELAEQSLTPEETMEAIRLYCGYLQTDEDNNYHRYVKCMAAILKDGNFHKNSEDDYLTGYVYEYVPDKEFGFILGFDLVSYFFRMESIASENVKVRINNNICSFKSVQEEDLVLVSFHRTRDSKRSYSAIDLV